MNKINFSKIPKSNIEHLVLLKSRGMTVINEERALFILDKISYFRLSGYWFQNYIDLNSKMFIKGTTFEGAFDKYCFDKEFRKIILSELEKIEVAVRAKIINSLSLKYNDPFWFENSNLFQSTIKHEALLDKLKIDFKKSDELFVSSFKKKYSNELPPSWIMLEITTFGSLSKLYENLNNYDKRMIAKYFNLPEKVFESWLHSIVYIRNVCAHHTRLWNRKLTISPKLLRNTEMGWSSNYNNNNSSYFIILIITYLLKTVNPHSTLKAKLINLFDNFTMIDNKIMGFSPSWMDEDIWQNN